MLSFKQNSAKKNLNIRLTPRAKKNQILGWKGDVLRVSVSAPPVEGKANSALIFFLADILDCKVSEIEIVKGHHSRDKIVSVPEKNLHHLPSRAQTLL